MALRDHHGLSPVAGPWGAPIAIPVTGTSRWLSFGPESSADRSGHRADGRRGRTTSATAAAALAVAVGVVGLLASLLRLSFRRGPAAWPILVGYMAGIAVLMIDSQIDRKARCVHARPDTVFQHVHSCSPGPNGPPW